MLIVNPLYAIDFYKADHISQYPEGTTEIYSNFTPRYVKTELPFFDNKVVVYGIQNMIQEFLDYQWANISDISIFGYRYLMKNSLSAKDFDISHLRSLKDLGYLPISIKALPEGTRCPIGVPLLTIRNTHPEFFWFTNYLETAISSMLWKPITVATIAFHLKVIVKKFALLTGGDPGFCDFQVHDFSFRGMSGIEDAIRCGAAHLTSFKGTDCVPAIPYIQRYFGQDESNLGFSVPATEHSVMTCAGKDKERDTVYRLITETYPEGIVSIVADSYDFWGFLANILPSMYKEIMERNGKLVIRPDSGDPFKIICGDPDSDDIFEKRGALRVLWDKFGGTINNAGFRVLDSHIGLIYGDSITPSLAHRILQQMADMGFCSQNIVFGVGSYTYQYMTRDTFGFAMKATSAVIGGQRQAIYKDPKTSNGSKKSAKGLIYVGKDTKGEYFMKDDVTEELEQKGELQEVYRDGNLLNKQTFSRIRDRLSLEVERLTG